MSVELRIVRRMASLCSGVKVVLYGFPIVGEVRIGELLSLLLDGYES